MEDEVLKFYDPYGIAHALDMGMAMYTHGRRGTGRTTLLLDALREGDMIIASTDKEAHRIVHEARKRGFEKIIGKGFVYRGGSVADSLSYTIQGSKRRIMFDHTFFEEFYSRVLADAMRGLAGVVMRYNDRYPEDPRERLNPINPAIEYGGLKWT